MFLLAFMIKGLQVIDLQTFVCGKTGIRTLGTRKGTTVFETVPFDRSGIFPCGCGCKITIIFSADKIILCF